MNPQKYTLFPLCIIFEITKLSEIKEVYSFRATCKEIQRYIDVHVYPYFTIAKCGSLYFGTLDSSANLLYVADYYHMVKEFNLSTNKVHTLYGTPTNCGMESQIIFPLGVTLDEKDKILYISDCGNYTIKRIFLDNKKIDINYELGNETPFNNPKGLAFDSTSNCLYVVETGNHSLIKIIVDEGKVETLCGNGEEGHRDGTFEEARFHTPTDIEFNYESEELYVTDLGNHVIRAVSLKDKTVRTLCGIPGVKGHQDGTHNKVKFTYPRGLGLDTISKCLYVCDTGNQVIRKIYLSGEVKVETICGTRGEKGDRYGPCATFHDLRGIIVDAQAHLLYVTDQNGLRKICDRRQLALNK